MRDREQAIKDELLKVGFAEAEEHEKLLAKLLWRPDLVLSRDKVLYPTEIKSNNTISPAYLDRIATGAADNATPLIIFSDKPKTQLIQDMVGAGISYGFMHGKRLCLEIPKRRLKNDIKKEALKKLSQIDIFVSSRQDIAERTFVRDRIEMLRKVSSYPFGPPTMVEYDRFEMENLYEYIKGRIEFCEWIIIVLEEDHSPVVSYEIDTAIEYVNHKNIFMFVKETAKCKDAWSKELDKVKSLEGSTVKYLPYSNLTELEVDLTRAVHKRMGEIYEEEGITMFK